VKRLAPEDLSPTIAIVGIVDLPEPVRTRDRGYRQTVANLLRSWRPTPGEGEDRFAESAAEDPVASCPDLPEHLAWVRRIERLGSEIRRLERRRSKGGAELVDQFRAIEALLENWGYVHGWKLTPRGEGLRFVYNELDLLLAEAIHRGVFADLGAADVAAVASMFTYQPRANDVEGGWPSREAAAAGDRIFEVWRQLSRDEGDRGVPETRPPEAGFAALAHAWTVGHELEDLFDEELAAGDFVRNCRQLLDLLRQLRDGFGDLHGPAAEAIRSINRGIVAAGGRL
jgi:ATP-dependent RNA helicase HelY